MISMRKWVGFLMALAFAAFALPAMADGADEKFTLVIGPPGTNLTNQMTVTIKNSVGDDDRIKAFKIPFGSNVQSVTLTNVTYSNPPSTLPTVSVDNAAKLISSNTVNLKGGQSITLTLTLTVTPITASCGSRSSTWTASAWGSTNYNNEKFTLDTAHSTLTASFTPACFTVDFNSNNGTPVSSQIVPNGQKATVPPPVPTRTGYTLAYWYLAATPNTAFDFNTAITAPITLFAKWTPIPQGVSFEPNGGLPPPAVQNVPYGSYATAPSPVPTKTGYTLTFWYLAATPNTGFDFASTPITAPILLLAKWDPIPQAVTFDSDGGTPTPATQNVLYGSKATVPTSAPTKAVYTFAYWYLTATPDTPFDFNTTITAPITLFAKWTPNNLSIISAPTSAALDTPFDVKIGLTPSDLTAVVSIESSTCGATATGGTSSGSSAPLSVTIPKPTSGPAPNSCAITFKATNYNAILLPAFKVFAAADLGCDNGKNVPYPISVGGVIGVGTYLGPLDPEADLGFTTTGWGLRRFDTPVAPAGAGCPATVNYTLTTGTDPSDLLFTTNLLIDKLNLPSGGNFKYVIVLDPRPIPPWPDLRPRVQWNTVGAPEYIDGLVCLSDDMSLADALVMPTIPAGIATGNYPVGTLAKMCIAQVGWTPVAGGLQYWVKVIDRSDGGVKFP
jgi:uncharacterized repeat protein (TIGR02543 family)